MTEPDHTPEPCEICGTTPEFVEREFPKLSSYHCPRCAAAVRACAGIPTEQLEAGSVAELIAAARMAPQYIFLAELEAKTQRHADLERDAHKDYRRLFAALAPFQDKED